jgi:UDP-galactopyranose mutase
MEDEILIVGAGISGAVLAERYATVLNKKVIIIDKRDHIGGNCFDFIDINGILVPKYGPHFFHTNDEEVWKYVNKFSTWHKYEHKVLSNIDGQMFVPVPVNIDTVNKIFSLNLKNEEDMIKWLSANTKSISNPKNSEESALKRVGKVLYELLFKNYTKKQWDMYPSELDPSVMDRIPVRTNFDDRYFTDKYQYMPTEGYTKLFERMLSHPNIKICLNSEFEEFRNRKFKKIFFTGRIDSFFNYPEIKKLQYRSLQFKFIRMNQEYFQSKAQINYPNTEDFTRITEPKWATNQISPNTTIIQETSTWDGEPYYPVPTQQNKDLYLIYKKLASDLEKEGVFFVGRLAEYKYFNMDQAFKNSLELFYKVENLHNRHI